MKGVREIFLPNYQLQLQFLEGIWGSCRGWQTFWNHHRLSRRSVVGSRGCVKSTSSLSQAAGGGFTHIAVHTQGKRIGVIGTYDTGSPPQPQPSLKVSNRNTQTRVQFLPPPRTLMFAGGRRASSDPYSYSSYSCHSCRTFLQNLRIRHLRFQYQRTHVEESSKSSLVVLAPLFLHRRKKFMCGKIFTSAKSGRRSRSWSVGRSAAVTS